MPDDESRSSPVALFQMVARLRASFVNARRRNRPRARRNARLRPGRRELPERRLQGVTLFAHGAYDRLRILPKRPASS
jgi:hypothetical protein